MQAREEEKLDDPIRPVPMVVIGINGDMITAKNNHLKAYNITDKAQQR